ncbi:MAG: phosphatidylserine decarboxylase family protein [Muribaculaceae bacterium]|nr:phosphatidylserine decarboxylase family protein [Muribaculaceae bacterium]
MRVKIHREGTGILVAAAILLLVINIPAWIFVRPFGVALSIVSAILYILMINFFRSPKRKFKGDPQNAVVASVDGTVVALEETFEDEWLHRRVIQLSMFMTILDVHANWFPVDGEVIYVKHHSGRYMSAYLPKSSTENERSTIVIKADNGQDILARQIAGAVARRIVTYAEPGVQASIEDHMGFIKFGSRVDIYLPLDAEILVKIGDKTTGGVTQVARLTNNSQNAPKN